MKTSMLTLSATVLALGFSTAAFAQTYTINGQAVPEDQVSRVQEYCSGLSADGGIGAGVTNSPADTETSGTNEDEASPSGTIDFTSADLTSIDADACTTGGFTVGAAASGSAGAAATTGTSATGSATTSTEGTAATGGGIGAGTTKSQSDVDSAKGNDSTGENSAAPSGSGN